jgi:hypothetical protein
MESPSPSDEKLSRFLKWWLWLWPGLTLLCFTWAWLDPSAFRKCPQVFWIYSVIGVSAAGWSWLRTLHRHYLLPAIVSAALGCIGFWLYWKLR